MSDSITFIRDQIIAAINASSLLPKIPIVSVYDSQANLESLTKGRIVVRPVSMEPRLASRAGDQVKKVKFVLAVQYKFTTDNHQELDPYLNLAESLSDFFLGYKFTTPIPGTTPPQLRNIGFGSEVAFSDGLWDGERMSKDKVFTSYVVVTVTYTFAK